MSNKKYWFNTSKLGALKITSNSINSAKKIATTAKTAKTALANPGVSLNPALKEDVIQATGQRVYAGIAERYFVDASDSYANAGMVIQFEHVPSGRSIAFKAFITALNETYSSDWASEQVYGRADPIHMFKNTTRNITMGFRVPASSEGEGFENLAKVQELVQYLYPNYDFGGRKPTAGNENSLTIAQSPLVRMRVMNLIAGRTHAGRWKKGSWEKALEGIGSFESLKSGDEWTANQAGEGGTVAQGDGAGTGGLLGIIKNFTVNHNLETTDYGAFELARGTIIPKLLEINLDFGVVHEHHIGWSSKGFSNPLFPYGVNIDASKPRDSATLLKEQISNATNYTDLMDEQREGALGQATVDQFQQNAAARYSGVFGDMRSKRDAKRLEETAGTTSKFFVRKIRNPETAAAIAGTYAASHAGATSVDISREMEIGFANAGGTDFDIADFIDY